MKRVLLTGGRGGIGSAICQKFTDNGYDVVAPNSQELDLSSLENISTYFQQTKPEFDVFIHCAGYNNPSELEKVTINEFVKTQNINLNSFVFIIQALIPYFKKVKKGHILGISSLYGTISRAKRLPYTVSKHGLVGAMQTVALELGKYNVCCNTLAPGFVDTPLTRKNLTAEEISKISDQIPLGALTTPKEIANTAFFLCSSENTAISGQNIIVDGGFITGGFQK